MAWNEKRVFRQKKKEENDLRIREESRRKALEERNYPTEKPEVEKPPKKLSRVQEMHRENERKREERRKELDEIDMRKKRKEEERKEWREKFKIRTKSGQILLNHRIEYTLKKIQEMKKPL